MRTNLQIALRFLLAKKRSMLMSLAGIAFGVGFIVLTQAVTTGFEEFFIRTILGTDGAIRVEDKFQNQRTSIAVEVGGAAALKMEVESDRKYQEGVAEPRQVIAALKRFPEIVGVSEVLRGNVSIESATREDSAQVFGIDLDDHLAVSDLERQIVRGDLADFRGAPSGLIVGSALAARLRLNPGTPVYIAQGGQLTRYRVAAVYQTGIRDIDRTRIFMHLSEARTLLKKAYGATYLQLRLRDPGLAREVAQRVELVVSHRATAWQEREEIYLGVFLFFRIAAAVLVSTIIIVSGLGMFNTLAMIVIEKTKEMAILRSMGFTRADIAAIFMALGAIVLTAGVAMGWGFGALCTWGIERAPLPVRGIFSTDHVVVAWHFDHYAGAALAAAAVVSVASWLPARRAARLEPAAIIRGTSQ